METTARLDASTPATTSPGIEQSTVQPALTPSAVQHGLRLSIVEGALANVHISITTGAFLTGFALLLGANDFALGVIAALPFLGQLFAFFGAYLEARTGERRGLTLWTALISRVAWGLLAVLPFIGGLDAARMPIFLVVLALSQALLGIAANTWISWMSDLVPPRQRGRYFGLRNTVGAVTAMVSTWLAGFALDWFRAAGDDRLGYAVIFGGAVVCAVAAAFFLGRQPEPPLAPARTLRPSDLFSAPLRHAGFRSFMLASAGWALVTGIAAPFFNAYGIQTLNLSFAMLAFFTIVTSAVTLVTQPFIGRLQDRYGDKRVLVVSVVGVVLLPWGWILSRPDFLLPLWCTQIFAGIFWPGINQGLSNLLMERAPAEGRGAFVATYGAVSGAGTFIASLLGGVVATGLGAAMLQLGPLSFDHYAILFALSSLGRLAMVFVFARRI